MDRIRHELQNLEDFHKLIAAIPPEFASQWANRTAVASGIHNIFNGVEDIFKSVAKDIDGSVPAGGDWHQDLLDQMVAEIEGIRPAVISNDLYELLNELKQFRHLVRHKYGVELKSERVEENYGKMLKAFTLFQNQLEAFETVMTKPE